MRDLDDLLTRLAQMPPDPRLDRLDEAVRAGLEQARHPVMGLAGLGAVAGLALVAGMLASQPHPAPPSLGMALAPSTLLGETR